MHTHAYLDAVQQFAHAPEAVSLDVPQSLFLETGHVKVFHFLLWRRQKENREGKRELEMSSAQTARQARGKLEGKWKKGDEREREREKERAERENGQRIRVRSTGPAGAPSQAAHHSDRGRRKPKVQRENVNGERLWERCREKKVDVDKLDHSNEGGIKNWRHFGSRTCGKEV